MKDKRTGVTVESGGLPGMTEFWFPGIIAGLYALIMGYFTFRYHPIGGFGVETDFYAELVPQVKKLLAGEFSPLNYGAKGPVYSLLLGFFTIIIRDIFRAGLALNIVSSAVFFVAVYFLIRRVFSAMTAQISLLLIVFNKMFQIYTYQAASDLPFLALCALSMLFLFRSERKRDIVLSAVFGLLAFLTRYNGAFIPIGTMIYFAVDNSAGVKERLKRAVLWAGVFCVVGSPWFISNWIVSGSPVRNDNYVNVMLEYYAYGSDKVTYENWTDAMPKEFTGLGDIILYDPVHFVRHTLRNIINHFYRDIIELIGLRLGIFMLAGLVAMWFAGLDRRKGLFFVFGFLYFLILTIVFYNPRFSLYLIVFYTPLAVWPFVSENSKGVLKKIRRFAPAVFLVIACSLAATTVRAMIIEFKNQPPVLTDLKTLGEQLGQYEPDKSKAIIARKPQIAYFAGLEYKMFPNNVTTIDGLVAYCKENGVDYILYSGVEAVYRPELDRLYYLNLEQPGLERLFHNKFGIVYKVKAQE